MELLYICVSQQYCWHMIIEVEWEDLRQKNSPHGIFTRFYNYCWLNLEETSFICNEVEIKFIKRKDKPHNEKITVTQNFQQQSFVL